MNRQAEDWLLKGRSDLALSVLLNGQPDRSGTNTPDTWWLLGHAYHAEQFDEKAIQAFKQFLRHEPDNIDALLSLAQSQMLCGFDATESFTRILQLAPSHKKAQHGLFVADVANGKIETTIDRLHTTLKRIPDWLEGHQLLISLEATHHGNASIDDALLIALRDLPNCVELYQQCFDLYCQTKQWHKAESLLEAMRKNCGDSAFLRIAKLFLAVENPDSNANVGALIAASKSLDDPMADLCKVRHFLKIGMLQQAESVAIARVSKSSALAFIPYLSLIWRLQGSQYYQWLEGNSSYVEEFKVDYTLNEIEELKHYLIELHSTKAPFIDQSIRGGTQTNHNLLLRHSPVIEKFKQKITPSIQRYVHLLPSGDVTHPLLGKPRSAVAQGNIKYSGSWSVRLKPQGYNVPHTHPKGWISAVFYVDLPDFSKDEAQGSGTLEFGTPPQELNLPLEKTHCITPTAGNLVLFPSTVWHSTVPFSTGERLVLAFDIKAPLF